MAAASIDVNDAGVLCAAVTRFARVLSAGDHDTRTDQLEELVEMIVSDLDDPEGAAAAGTKAGYIALSATLVADALVDYISDTEGIDRLTLLHGIESVLHEKITDRRARERTED